MVQITNKPLLSLLFTGALATSMPPLYNAATGLSACMTADQGQQVLLNWQQLLSNFSIALAESTLAENFTDYSASAASLNNICPQAPVASPPLLDPLFTNRTQFEAGQSLSKPLESTILQTWFTCDTAIMRWVLTNTTENPNAQVRPVVGVVAFDTVPAPAGNKFPFLIATSYSESDSEAWIANLQDNNQCNTAASA